MKHIKLGQLLVHRGMIQEWQFLTAMGARRPGQKLGEVMIERRFLSEDQLLEALAMQLGLPIVKLAGITVAPEAIQAMPGHVARRFSVFPIALSSSGLPRLSLGRFAPSIALADAQERGEVPTLTVAMTDPTDERMIEALRFLLECDVQPVLASRRDILRAIERTYGPDDPGSADILPIPFARNRTGRAAMMAA
jgi:type IV pilus assembly protein PilB